MESNKLTRFSAFNKQRFTYFTFVFEYNFSRIRSNLYMITLLILSNYVRKKINFKLFLPSDVDVCYQAK